jgi:hypothetical protein
VAVLFPQLAVTPSGDAVLTWYRSDGANNRVQARTHSAAGVLGATATLSDAGQPAFAPKVGVDAGRRRDRHLAALRRLRQPDPARAGP